MPITVSPRRARRGPLVLALLALVGLVIPGAVWAAKPPPAAPVTIQLLNVSDWHGNVDPLSVFGVGNLGGAWNISARWAEDRLSYPTLTLTAGDDFGATPALVNSFDEIPAVLAERLMGIQVSTFGNHNFDKGTTFLQEKIDIAGSPSDGTNAGDAYRYVASNLKNISSNLSGVDPIAYFNVSGVKVAVIGIVNEEAPTLVFPGNFGTIQPTDGVAAANKFARIARNAGANAVIVITHKGVRGFNGAGNTDPFGELIDFTAGVDPDLVDVVLGDHTNIQWQGSIHGVLVHENLSFGQSYARTFLTVQPGRGGGVLDKSAEFVQPLAGALTDGNTKCPATGYCDQAVVDMLVPFRTSLGVVYNTQVGDSTKPISRADQCGRSDGRLCESLVGDVVADAIRATYGADFALTNSGGLRAPLTCPTGDTDPSSTDFCPASLYPIPNGGLYPITRGKVNDVLPFGNISATVTINGAEFKSMLERGVSAMPGADGRFPQISGFCFTYDVNGAVGSRIMSAVWANPDGTCSATAVDLTAGSSYKIASNNFTLSAGDGYPDFSSRMTTFNLLDDDVAAWIAAHTPIAPAVLGYPDGRINCYDGNGVGTANDCPTLTVSP